MRILLLSLLVLGNLVGWFPIAANAASASPAGGAAVMTSPIRHWDASWAASCAQGTAIALRYQNCALLFLRSPATNIWRPSIIDGKNNRAEENILNLWGLNVIPIPAQPSSSADVTVQFGPSWLAFENSLCAMTGLASDVEHLSRVMQRQVDGHFNIYQKPPTTHVMQHKISRLLQQANHYQGSRPFGAQIVLLGCDGITNNKAPPPDNNNHVIATGSDGVCFYTIDPSGSWQSWGGRGTAIGKFAAQVRAQLSKVVLSTNNHAQDNTSSSKNDDDDDDGLLEGLKTIYKCWKLVCKEENVSSNRESEDYQVLVLWRDEKTQECRLGMVDEENLNTILASVEQVMAKE